MRNIFTIILIFITIPVFAQFPDKHMEMLSKMNCELSDAWSIEIEQDSTYGTFNCPAIIINLMSYKTEVKKGSNYGVGICLFHKQYADSLKSHDWDDRIGQDVFSETKSYIVLISYYTGQNDTYTKMITKLIPEVLKYFKDNKDLL